MSEEMTIPETEYDTTLEELPKKRFGFYLKALLLLFTVIALGLIAAGWTLLTLNNPPAEFPVNEPVVITPGTQVRAITEQLKAEGVVQSQQLLYYILVFMHDPADLKASTYVFDEPLDTLAVARRLTEGDFDTDLIRLTHIEGESVAFLTNRADALLPDFDEEFFALEAKQYEGKLYPETYFIPVTYTASELLSLMLETYAETTQSLQPAFASSTLSEDEVIILASILEREANSPESMGIVSGILQNRLAIDMPLQADATIEYAIETPLGELPPGQLAAELRELDSPYNTYLYTGLPPTPIGNPGLEAITAALQPVESEYFYYITGDDGEFYYAETYTQHLRNIEQHLR